MRAVYRLASCSVDIKRVEIRVHNIRLLAVLTLLTHVPTGLSLAAPRSLDGLWLHDPFYPCDFMSCTKSHTRCGLWLTHSIRVTLYRVQSLALLVGSLSVCCSISPLSLSVFSKWKTIVSVVLFDFYHLNHNSPIAPISSYIVPACTPFLDLYLVLQ